MTKNIRRFATVLTLTAVLAATPAFAGPRNGEEVPDRPSLVRVIKKFMKKITGLVTFAAPTIPIPPNSPDNN